MFLPRVETTRWGTHFCASVMCSAWGCWGSRCSSSPLGDIRGVGGRGSRYLCCPSLFLGIELQRGLNGLWFNHCLPPSLLSTGPATQHYLHSHDQIGARVWMLQGCRLRCRFISFLESWCSETINHVFMKQLLTPGDGGSLLIAHIRQTASLKPIYHEMKTKGPCSLSPKFVSKMFARKKIHLHVFL